LRLLAASRTAGDSFHSAAAVCKHATNNPAQQVDCTCFGMVTMPLLAAAEVHIAFPDLE